MTSKEIPIELLVIYSPDQQRKIENIKEFLTFLYRTEKNDIILHTKEVEDENEIDDPKNVKYYKFTSAVKDYDSILNGIMMLDRQTDARNIHNNKKMEFYDKVVTKYKNDGYYDMLKTKLELNDNDVKLYLPLLRLLIHIYGNKHYYDKEELDDIISGVFDNYIEWNKNQNADSYDKFYVRFKGGTRRYKKKNNKTKRKTRKSKKSRKLKK